jgi:hypothetical protein
MGFVKRVKYLFLGTADDQGQSLASKLSNIAGKQGGRIRIQPAPKFGFKRAR